MFILLFRGFFLMGIISWYSMNVWNFIDGYFRNEYKRYLDDEVKRHPHLRPDVTTTTTQLPPTENEIIEFKLAPKDENNHVIMNEIEKKRACNHQQDSCQITQKTTSTRMDYDNDYHDDYFNDDDNQEKEISLHMEEAEEEDEFINYWRSRRGKEKVDNSNNNNLYCNAVEEVNCVDN
jgi:hypothetical protein